ncbi:MAG TPA: TIGR00730 family Rossman fold protein [Acidimicrobiales bacterium]|nr:TIGR00730 family Rossman fold protein [Acidimicrobiales bacterium]
MTPTESLRPLHALAVFCGSSRGAEARYFDAARDFGALLAGAGIALVYGGGNTGLMGALAEGALSSGGEVHGVITRALEDKEVAHRGLTSMRVVETMHERKAVMADLASGFVMLPGGFGTLDEFFEAVTWTQLGIHDKPCGVLDVGGFFAPLSAFVAQATAAGFVRVEHTELMIVEGDGAALLGRLAAWRGLPVEKWLDPSER